MLGTRLRITPYTRQHRRALLELAWSSPWTHRHLDWHETGQWLDGELGHVFLAWQRDDLIGYIGLSRPISGSSWIRLLGIRDGRMPGRVINELWERAQADCLERGTHTIAILMTTNWLPTYLPRHGFRYADDVITMSHIGSRLPAERAASVSLRAADADDLPCILEIDRLAFQPLWQLTRSDIWQGLRASTNPSVATLADRVVAYQFSIRREEAGHLARLAVHPAHRRQRIASALLQGVLDHFQRRQVEAISVNTQLSNLPSQRLYQRYGFFRNGYDIELWQKTLG